MAPRPLYLMLKPPREIALLIARLRRQFGIIGTYGEDRFHITLLPLGDARDFAPAMFDAIYCALASLSMEPLPILFDRIRFNALTGSRFRRLYDLQRALRSKFTATGLNIPLYEFRPHLSLAYGDCPLRNIAAPPVEWLANEVLLVRSIRGEGRHEILARQPLVTRQQSFAFA